MSLSSTASSSALSSPTYSSCCANDSVEEYCTKQRENINIFWKKKMVSDYCNQVATNMATQGTPVHQTQEQPFQDTSVISKRSKNKEYVYLRTDGIQEFLHSFRKDKCQWSGGTVHNMQNGIRREFYKCRNFSCSMGMRLDFDLQSQQVQIFMAGQEHNHERHQRYARVCREASVLIKQMLTVDKTISIEDLMGLLREKQARESNFFPMPTVDQVRSFVKRNFFPRRREFDRRLPTHRNVNRNK